MGLTAGPVPARVDASVKAGLLDLVDHAVGQGWTRRAACALLGLDDLRAARWARRRDAGRLEDAIGGVALHGLLDCERAAIVEVFEAWGEIDRSARKLAHRGSRLDTVHVSPSTVRRVLTAEGLVLKGFPPRDPAPRSPWPDWLEWKPNRIWAYDVTHFTRAEAVRGGDPGHGLPQVDHHPGLRGGDLHPDRGRLHPRPRERRAARCRRRPRHRRPTRGVGLRRPGGDRAIIGQGQVPLLLAVSDNGPQMRSVSTREFLAGVAIAQQFGRPHTPTDQAWIETLFGHVKGEWPHLEKITDPGDLVAELDRVQPHYNGVRLHAGIGYVTPNDEHEGRGDQIRQARRDGMTRARPGPDRLPSNQQGEPTMITHRPWLGISEAMWLVCPDTPQLQSSWHPQAASACMHSACLW